MKYDHETGMCTFVKYEKYDCDIRELEDRIDELNTQNINLEEENLDLKSKLNLVKKYVNAEFNDQILVSALRELLKDFEVNNDNN